MDLTSNTPSPISMRLTSSVPPPKSYTSIFWSDFLSRPYASDAAVGSLIIRTTSSPAISPASLVACLWLSLKYAGTVMTAFSTVSPRKASASCFIFCKIKADISCGLNSLSLILTFSPVPIFRLIAITVPSVLVTACLRAGSPTNLCPSSVKATTDGNAFPPALAPSALGIIVGLPPISAAAAELLVPRSIPIIFAIQFTSS